MTDDRLAETVRKLVHACGICLIHGATLRICSRPSSEAKQNLRNPAHLDLLGALGDTVAAMMAVNMLEGLVARVAQAAMHLHRAVCRIAHEPVCAVIAHRDLIGEPLGHL